MRSRNEAVADAPELINSDPYGAGWIFEVEADPVTKSNQLGELLDADGYQRLVED